MNSEEGVKEYMKGMEGACSALARAEESRNRDRGRRSISKKSSLDLITKASIAIRDARASNTVSDVSSASSNNKKEARSGESGSGSSDDVRVPVDLSDRSSPATDEAVLSEEKSYDNRNKKTKQKKPSSFFARSKSAKKPRLNWANVEALNATIAPSQWLSLKQKGGGLEQREEVTATTYSMSDGSHPASLSFNTSQQESPSDAANQATDYQGPAYCDVRAPEATVEGQLVKNPHLTRAQAQEAARREYNRRNAARARLRNKQALVDLRATCAELAEKADKLVKQNKHYQEEIRRMKHEQQQRDQHLQVQAAAAATQVVAPAESLLGNPSSNRGASVGASSTATNSIPQDLILELLLGQSNNTANLLPPQQFLQRQPHPQRQRPVMSASASLAPSGTTQASQQDLLALLIQVAMPPSSPQQPQQQQHPQPHLSSVAAAVPENKYQGVAHPNRASNTIPTWLNHQTDSNNDSIANSNAGLLHLQSCGEQQEVRQNVNNTALPLDLLNFLQNANLGDLGALLKQEPLSLKNKNNTTNMTP